MVRNPQNDARDPARALLVELGTPRWLSLCPGRGAARPLAEIPIDRAIEEDARVAIARGLCAIARAVERSFPNNLFCDLELVGATLGAQAAREGAGGVERVSSAIVELHERFGCATELHFRYVHDFLYGFDWARWVRRDPEARAGVGPFDAAFLAHARRRGDELASLIAEDDPKYGRLPEGTDRNPFPFARDPASEELLLRDLAARGWIPVEAWRADATPDWTRDYVTERERRARELGLERAEGGRAPGRS